MKTKLIFSPQLAQWLLNHDCKIVDIKPKRNYPNETVFVFKVEDNFLECMEEWYKHRGDKDDRETF